MSEKILVIVASTDDFTDFTDFTDRANRANTADRVTVSHTRQ